MKKILMLLTAIVAVYSLKAQTSGAVITTSPANFTAVDQVVITIDVSAVGNLVGKEPLFIWTWDPGDPAPGNGSWGSSSDARMLTKIGPNRFTWTINPSLYYGKPPAEITQLQFLVKARDGSGDAKTNDIKLLVAPLIYVPSVFRTFPAAVGQNDIINTYLDQNLATDLITQRMTPVSADVKLINATGGQVGTTRNYLLKSAGDKRFSFNIFPRGEFVIPTGTRITKIQVEYKGTMLSPTGGTTNVTSPVFETLLEDLK